MVGDTLKKASASPGGSLIEIKDFSDAEYFHIPLPPYLNQLSISSDLLKYLVSSLQEDDVREIRTL